MLQEHRDEVLGLLSRETEDWRVEQEEIAVDQDKMDIEATTKAPPRPQNAAVRIGDYGQAPCKLTASANLSTTPDGSTTKLPPIGVFPTLNANSHAPRSPMKR